MDQSSWLSKFLKSFRKSESRKQVEENLPVKGGTVAREKSERRKAQSPIIADAIPWEIGTKILDDYIVEGILGQGGMGTVYLVARRSFDDQRFAVKTLLTSEVKDAEKERLFLQELRTWIDLPNHPNLTACRFFRTVGDRIAIFAEYVNGGSLHEWIKQRKLLTIDRILDVAIQFAWGLQAAHDRNVIHQDVKPANVLMTQDGFAKVTDFGIARALNTIGISPAIAREKKSILVSAGGMTEAYCSPEQSRWEKLSHRTDIWSYGLSILEMFTGEVTWSHGIAAPYVLENYLSEGVIAPYPAMPECVVKILQRCFQSDPRDRWDCMNAIADELEKNYPQVTGSAYPRKKPEIDQQDSAQRVTHDRRTIYGVSWSNPEDWLRAALKEAGRDESEMERLIPTRTGSRRAQALVDLQVYEEAVKIYSDLISQGRKELERSLANLLTNKAFVHQNVNDGPGAILMYEKAIVIWERLVNQEGREELAKDLVKVYGEKVIALCALGDNRSAVTLSDKAIAIWERLVIQEGHKELAGDLAVAYMNFALALSGVEEKRSAVMLYNKAIAIMERLVIQEGRKELAGKLAVAYMNFALALSGVEEKRSAVMLYNKAIAIMERLVIQDGRKELANYLAMIYTNKANALTVMEYYREAITLYDKAIAIRELLVTQEGRKELANDLATVYKNKAVAMGAFGDSSCAVTLLDKAIAIIERLVIQEGRKELLHDLAGVYLGKAMGVSDLGDHQGAAEQCDKAVRILERLVNREGRKEFADALAVAYATKANALTSFGDYWGAVALYDQAIAIRKRLVNQEGCKELLGDLALMKAYRSEILIQSGEILKAKKDATEAVSILESEIKRTGRSDLQNDLNWVRSNLKSVLE